jgi:hypothetical protein
MSEKTRTINLRLMSLPYSIETVGRQLNSTRTNTTPPYAIGIVAPGVSIRRSLVQPSILNVTGQQVRRFQ